VVTFDDLVAFGPYLISISAAIVAFFNIYYTYIKDRPNIKITVRNAKITPKRVNAVCTHITNIGGKSITILFPDIILPNGSILYLMPGLGPTIYADPRKKGLEPSLAAGAISGWPTYFQHPSGWGQTPPFPYELAPGKLSAVWVENSSLAEKLKELGYGGGEVNLKVCVTDAAEKQYMSDEIIFDVDKAKLRLLT
jgi:hypothetical protein